MSNDIYYGDDIEGDDLNMDIDLSDTRSEDDIGVGRAIPSGKYHATLKDVKQDHKSQKPCFLFTFGILDGEHRGFENQEITERLYITGKTRARVRMFAHRLGLLSKQ